MRRLLAATIACLGVSTGAAHAVDWTINSTVSESVELNDNQFMRVTPAGSVGSYTNLSSIVSGTTPTTRFDFTPSFNFRRYWGPGTEGTTLVQSMDEGAKLHFEHTDKIPRDREYIDASWARRDIAAAVLNELGLPTTSIGNLDTITGSIGIDRNLTTTDLLTFNARTTSTSYEPANAGTPFYDTGATSTFRHQSNRIAALTGSSEFEWLHFANAVNTNIYILREMAGLDIQPMRGLSFNGSAGAAIVHTRQNPNPNAPAQPTSGTAIGFISNALLSYQLLEKTVLTFNAVQSISPSVVGSLSQLTSFSLTLGQTINQASNINISGNISRSTTSGVQSDFWSVSTSYSYQLAREWTFQATYRFLQRTSTAASSSLIFDPITGVPTVVASTGSTRANSNSILLVLTKQFVVLPRGS